MRLPFTVLMLLAMHVVCAHPHKKDLSGSAHEIEHAAGLYLEGEVAAAVPLLQQAIKDLEADRGQQADELVTPLGFLGASYLQLGQSQLALEAIERARRISWQTGGRDNTRQLPLLYVEAEALKELGREEQAEHLYRQAVQLTEARHGSHSLQAALSLGRLAEWKASSGEYEQAVLLFSRSIDQARAAAGGQDSAEMLPLLQGMARVFLAEGFVPGRALPLIRRVVELTDQHSNNFDPATRVEARLLFGDILMRLSHEREAVAAYKEAWQIANQQDLGSWLNRLAVHEKVAGALIHVSEVPENQDYFIFSYQLRNDGRPARVALLETNAAPVRARWAIQQFRGLRFRPAFDNGVPQEVAVAREVFVY